VFLSLVEVEAGNNLTMFLSIVYRLKKRMARVIEKTNYLLASIDYFMVAYATGIRQSHSASFRILNDILYTDKKVLYFTGLLPNCLGQNNAQSVGIGSLRSANHRHIGTVGTAAGDDLVAGEHKRVGKHFHKLLMRQRQVTGADYCHFARAGLLYQEQFLGQLVDSRYRSRTRFKWRHMLLSVSL